MYVCWSILWSVCWLVCRSVIIIPIGAIVKNQNGLGIKERRNKKLHLKGGKQIIEPRSRHVVTDWKECLNRFLYIITYEMKCIAFMYVCTLYIYAFFWFVLSLPSCCFVIDWSTDAPHSLKATLNTKGAGAFPLPPHDDGVWRRGVSHDAITTSTTLLLLLFGGPPVQAPAPRGLAPQRPTAPAPAPIFQSRHGTALCWAYYTVALARNFEGGRVLFRWDRVGGGGGKEEEGGGKKENLKQPPLSTKLLNVMTQKDREEGGGT